MVNSALNLASHLASNLATHPTTHPTNHPIPNHVPNTQIHLLSLETALPKHQIAQSKTRDLVAGLFPEYGSSPRHLGIFDHAAIDFRYFAMPLAWYAQTHSLEERNELYKKEALELGVTAAQKALEAAGLRPDQIGAVIWVSNSGFATPSLDSKLIQRLGLSRHIFRLPVAGLGCAAGASTLGKAFLLAQSLAQPVLLVSSEVNSLTFIRQDYSKANFVSSGLFADGAAAAVLGRASNVTSRHGLGSGARGDAQVDSRMDAGIDARVILHNTHSTLIDDTENVMGFKLTDLGLQVWLSQDIPHLIRSLMPQNFEDACSSWGISQSELKHFAMHPGGAKILDALEGVLGLHTGDLVHSRAVLRNCGNMSGPTVLFVLKALLESRPATGKGILSAMGPGFSIEHVLFEVL